MKITKPYIIAEIGINHEGSLKRAIKLIRSAKKAGADAVKFQVFKPETLARKNLKKTSQQEKLLSKKITLEQMWKKMSLSFAKLKLLKKTCGMVNIDFICSVFDKESLEKILKLNPKYIKIASSDINDVYLLDLIKKTKKKVILSTGMSNKQDINRAIKILGKSIFLLHCVSSYPCPDQLANLKRILTIKKEFNIKVGYSDHTIGNFACYIAMVLGAEVIEKHFTHNKKLKGGDHLLSADENDLREIVKFSKNLKKLLGTGNLKPSKYELKNKKLFRKGIYYSRDLILNHKLQIDDIIFARPETKINITQYKNILRKKLKYSKKKHDKVEIRDL